MRIFLQIKKAWTVPVIDVDGELGFELPDEVIDQLGLSPGDIIIWEQYNKDSWVLKKREEK
jgi:hypothetical protein